MCVFDGVPLADLGNDSLSLPEPLDNDLVGVFSRKTPSTCSIVSTAPLAEEKRRVLANHHSDTSSYHIKSRRLDPSTGASATL